MLLDHFGSMKWSWGTDFEAALDLGTGRVYMKENSDLKTLSLLLFLLHVWFCELKSWKHLVWNFVLFWSSPLNETGLRASGNEAVRPEVARAFLSFLLPPVTPQCASLEVLCWYQEAGPELERHQRICHSGGTGIWVIFWGNCCHSGKTMGLRAEETTWLTLWFFSPVSCGVNSLVLPAGLWLMAKDSN